MAIATNLRDYRKASGLILSENGKKIKGIPSGMPLPPQVYDFVAGL